MKETRAVTVIVITGKVSEMCVEDVDSGKDGRPYPTGCGHHTAWPGAGVSHLKHPEERREKESESGLCFS